MILYITNNYPEASQGTELAGFAVETTANNITRARLSTTKIIKW